MFWQVAAHVEHSQDGSADRAGGGLLGAATGASAAPGVHGASRIAYEEFGKAGQLLLAPDDVVNRRNEGVHVFVSVLLAACIASILWFAMARRILAGIRGSEERYRLLFDSPAQALVALQGCVTYVFATMVLYAVFIPNTPRRAATVVVPLALLPILVLLLMRLGP